MKKILLPLVAIMLNLVSANAQKENNMVVSAGQLKNIILGDRMKVVLVKALPHQKELNVSEQVFKKLKVTFSGSDLVIEPYRNLSKDDVVYVLVNEVESLSLGQNTTLRNEGIWLNGAVKVYVSDGATATINTNGDVQGFPLGESGVRVVKRPITLQPSANIF